MTANQAIADAIREVQSFVSADGADLKLIDCNEERKQLRLRLDLSRVPCLDCVVPAPMLASLIQRRIQEQVDGWLVEVDDPRAVDN
jgi:hypothetical protein